MRHWLGARVHRAVSRYAAARGLELVRRDGYDLVARDWTSCVPQVGELPDGFWERRSPLAGVALDLERAFARLEADLAPGLAEFTPPGPGDPVGPGAYRTGNASYERPDADVLHAVVRWSRPHRIVELGGGWSTLVAAAAARQNDEEGHPARYDVFEPHPLENLSGPVPGLDALHREGAAGADPALLAALGDGDLLIVDTTHTVKIGSEVLDIVLDLLPRLAPGVLVHFHDVFLPRHYPRTWVEVNHWYWAEQYLLQAFLAHNADWEIVLPLAAMADADPDRLAHAVPGYTPGSLATSLWIRRRGMQT